MASLAEYERKLIRGKTNAGLQSARARARLDGRPKGYTAEAISKLSLIGLHKKMSRYQQRAFINFFLDCPE